MIYNQNYKGDKSFWAIVYYHKNIGIIIDEAIKICKRAYRRNKKRRTKKYHFIVD